MKREITASDVDKVEAALAAAKQTGDPVTKQAAMDRCVAVRSAFREQEVKAGRRQGLVNIVED